MFWLALMSVEPNKHFPMLESRRYAVRLCQRLCSSCQELYHSVFFSFFFTASGFETTRFWAISKQIIDNFLQILDENGRDDT